MQARSLRAKGIARYKELARLQAERETEARRQANTLDPMEDGIYAYTNVDTSTDTDTDADDTDPGDTDTSTDSDANTSGTKPTRNPNGGGAAELSRKSDYVEAKIRELKDDRSQAKRDIRREQKRLEELVKEESVVKERDRRAQRTMATLHRAIELTRHGATLQRGGASDMTRQATGQGLAEAGARARGHAHNDKVKEQVEEDLWLAEKKDRSADALDRSAEDLEARVQQLQTDTDNP